MCSEWTNYSWSS